MIVKVKDVAEDVAARHPGSAGFSTQDISKPDFLNEEQVDWLWPIRWALKIVVFVVLLFALPAPISFFLFLGVAGYYLNKIHRRYSFRKQHYSRFVWSEHLISDIDSGSSVADAEYKYGQSESQSVNTSSPISDFHEYEDSDSFSFGCGDINPASGLPMIEDTCIDVGGNVFGDDSMTRADSGDNCGISSDLFDSSI